MRNCGREEERGRESGNDQGKRAIRTEIETERGRERERMILSPFFNLIFFKELIFLMILIPENSHKILKLSIKNVNSLYIQKNILDESISLKCS